MHVFKNTYACNFKIVYNNQFLKCMYYVNIIYNFIIFSNSPFSEATMLLVSFKDSF